MAAAASVGTVAVATAAVLPRGGGRSSTAGGCGRGRWGWRGSVGGCCARRGAPGWCGRAAGQGPRGGRTSPLAPAPPLELVSPPRRRRRLVVDVVDRLVLVLLECPASQREEVVAVGGTECAAGARAPASKLTIREALPRKLGWSWAARVALPRAAAALVSHSPPPTARPPSRRAPRLVGHLVVLSQLSSSLAAHLALPCANRACGALGAVDWLYGSCGARAGSAPAVRRQCASCSGSAALKRPTALWGWVRPEALEAPPLCLSLRWL